MIAPLKDCSAGWCSSVELGSCYEHWYSHEVSHRNSMTTQELINTSKIIAVVGISEKPGRPANDIPQQLFHRGFTIIPVNPMLREWRGIPAYPSVSEIPAHLSIDIVDIFRKPEAVPEVVRDVLSRTSLPRAIWLQQGITSAEARGLTEQAGIFFVEDRCLGVEAAFAQRP